MLVRLCCYTVNEPSDRFIPPACDNEPMTNPAPVRITIEQGTAAAVNRRFIGGFFAFAILFAGAAFYRPAIQAFAVGFPIYLVLWNLRLRGTSRRGDALVVSPDRLTYEAGKRSSRVERVEVDAVRFKRSSSKTELSALNSAREPAFRVEIEERARVTNAATLAAQGWPVQNTE